MVPSFYWVNKENKYMPLKVVVSTRVANEGEKKENRVTGALF